MRWQFETFIAAVLASVVAILSIALLALEVERNQLAELQREIVAQYEEAVAYADRSRNYERQALLECRAALYEAEQICK